MIVLFWSRATRDLLKSFGWGIAALHSVRLQRRSCHVLATRPIGSSSTRAREVGWRAPTAEKLTGSPKPAVDAHRRPSISSYPAPGQESKDIVVLDRWGEDRTEGAVSSLARSRLVSVL